MLNSLTKYIYDPSKFKTSNECAICFCEYESDAQITPLPCSTKHYFHTACITEWLKTKAECPICRHPVTISELEAFNKNVETMLQEEAAA